MEYKQSKQLLLEDLYNLKDNKEIKIYYGDKLFTPLMLIKEIENETEIGIHHIKAHCDIINKI